MQGKKKGKAKKKPKPKNEDGGDPFGGESSPSVNLP
jgi:hypothetical protein